MAHQPKPATVAAYQTLRATKIADTEATFGAVVGVNLFTKDGELYDPTNGSGTTPGIDTSDDVQEGQYNLYFTNQRAQDAVGGILTDSASIDFTYNQTTHIITADLKDTGVSAGSYGSQTQPRFVAYTVDAKGRITDSHNGLLMEAGSGVTFDYSTAGKLIIKIPDPNTYVELVDENGNVLIDENGFHLTDGTVATTVTPFDPTLVWSFL